MKAMMPVAVVVALTGGCAFTTTSWVSEPSDPQNVIVEKEIRKQLNKPTGELTEADLKKVKGLNLRYTKITDAGLKEVAKLQQLKAVVLLDTKVTKAGVAELRKALPNCLIFNLP